MSANPGDVSPGTVAIAPNSTGARTDTVTVTLPAGTVVQAVDGTFSKITSDTIAFRQVVAIGDPTSNRMAAVSGEAGQGALRIDNQMLARLDSIDKTMRELLFWLKATTQG